MSIINLDKIFKPRRVALLGGDWHLGTSVLKNLLGAGFQGAIYPIDPHREAVNGVPAYSHIGKLPKIPDVALVCTPAERVPSDVEECARAGVRGIVILSEGFREAGATGQALEREILEIAKGFPGLRIIGPNSLGFIAPRLHLNASHAATLPAAGHLVFISESRALCSSVIDWAVEAGVGFSYFVSVGNMLDVDFGDLIDYFGTDPNTWAIILYLQSIENARGFMSAASAFARKKPIVVYKAGHFVESARVAASHTGAMVAEDAVYAAAFQRAGAVRVTELDDVFDVAEVLASQWIPKGPRLAIVGNAGGPAVIATDVLLARDGVLATLNPETVEKLNGVLSPLGSHINPVDLLDDAPPTRFADAVRIILMDQEVDGVLVIFAVQRDIDSKAVAKAISDAAREARKPILVAWMGGSRARDGMPILTRTGIPTYSDPERAVRAFLYLVTYARNIDALYQTPRDIPIDLDPDRIQLRKKLGILVKKSGYALNDHQAKTLLGTYGIPVVDTQLIHRRETAVSYAERMGYPVVLKVLSSKIPHKTDAGGVALDLKNAREVEDAYDWISDNIRRSWQDADVEGISVQKMVKLEQGFEMILGAKRDPTFGTVIMVGMGGFAADVIHDRQIGLPPLNEQLAIRMLRSLRHWPVLQGYRGHPGINVEKLIEIMLRFSSLVTDYPEIREFDINPLLVGTNGVIALDTAVILDPETYVQETESHQHMAIRPYPEDHIHELSLECGTRVVFRPVKPEDEPMWHKLIACSSERSIRRRFRSFFQVTTHRMAVEYCVVDYEREIAIVVETTVDGERELIGVAHLYSDTNLDSAEYAIIISDPWQGKGLGGKLLDHCLELARRLGIKRVVADAEIGNKPMLGNFLSRGFKSEIVYEDGIVYLEKPLFGE
uniref:Acetyltransferase n=1 Tax=Candidatus Kentrum sp. FW TaxID=2126338 RepID=A0A450SHT9_9GAMM|nr:MAG: acetyltransferase [Candidatus Kentron sp. FW]